MTGSTTALHAQSHSHTRNDKNIDPNSRDTPRVNPTPVNVIVAGAGLDTCIPIIPEVRDSNVKSKFKMKVLTRIDGRPIYKKMRALTQELGRNTLGIHVPFEGREEVSRASIQP